MTDKRTYCQRQIEAVLKICIQCRHAGYVTNPTYEICPACRAGIPPVGPYIPRWPPLLDAAGNVIDGP